MSLLTFDDIGFLIAFILPGYVTLAIYQKISLAEPIEKEMDKIVLSLIFSTFLYLPYVFLKQIWTIEEVKKDVFIFSNYLTILVYATIIGSVSGIATRFFFRKDVIEGKAWNDFFKTMPEEGAWISVKTTKGNEYIGKLYKSSILPRYKTQGSVILREPKLVIRDSDGAILNLQDLGTSSLHIDSEIETVIFSE